MRKWCVLVAMGLFMALPAVAQQKASDAGDNGNASTATADSTSVTAASSETSATIAPAGSNIFAVPMPPRATPFPAPSAFLAEPAGKLVPKFELGFLFQYLYFVPKDPFTNFNGYGGSGEVVYNPNSWLGIVGQGAGYTFHRDLTPIASTDPALTNPSSVNGGINTVLFGPRLNWRKFNHFVPFGEFLVGFAHGGGAVAGGSQYTFALAAGGGLDIVLWKNVAWRFAEVDYLGTNFDGIAVGPTARQNSLRVGTGVVLRFGFAASAPPPNHPPVAACAANPASVFAGAGSSVQIHVSASDPDNDSLTYSYTATGGTVDGAGPDARWSSSGVGVGTYTVNAKVDDGKGGTATCSADIAVQPKPNQPPTISCSTDRSPIMPGERTGITATASDPDGDPLSYSYTTTGGQIVGSGPHVEFDSTGVQPGSYTVKCSVSDGRGGNADSSTNVDVQQPPPPPQATKVGDCGYTKPGASRFDNLCKRVGDDVALRLKNDPNAKVVIVGFADPKEPKHAKLAAERAELAKKYLGEKGIDASRVSTRTGEAAAGPEKDNRRVDFIFVPEGATY